MRVSAAAALLALVAAPLTAQQKADASHDAMHAAHHTMTPAHDSVMATVKRLFDGMRARDTAMMRSAFAAGTVLGEVPRAGAAVRFTTIDAFIGGIGRAPAGQLLDERLYDPEIRLDGGLATVWVYYTFHIGERLSHCGYDAFQVVRTGEGWKIIGLADTRQTTGCTAEGRKRVG